MELDKGKEPLDQTINNCLPDKFWEKMFNRKRKNNGNLNMNKNAIPSIFSSTKGNRKSEMGENSGEEGGALRG
jgi:hypothetical protein